jgi:hypothetical protein
MTDFEELSNQKRNRRRVAQVPRKRIAPLKVGAPGPSHLGTRETANPNWTTPEFLTFRLYHRLLVSNQYFGPSQNLRQPTSFGVRDGLPTIRPQPAEGT